MVNFFAFRAFLFASAISIFSCKQNAAQGVWEQKADFPSSSRHHGLGFSIGKRGYFGMGQKQTKPFVYKIYSDMWEYDSEKDTWTQKSDFPGEGRINTKGFLINRKFYAGFGYVIAAYGPSAGTKDHQVDLYEFDPDANTWTRKKDNYIENGDICFVIKNIMYAVNPEYRMLKRYNPSADTWIESNWDKKAVQPTYTAIIGGDVDFCIGEKEYIITTVRKKGNFVNQLWEFSPYSISWNKKNDLPSPGCDSLNAFSIGEKGYVMRRGKDFLEYDPASDSWTKKISATANNEFYQTFSIEQSCYGFIKTKFWKFVP